jgi:hypothetical protein
MNVRRPLCSPMKADASSRPSISPLVIVRSRGQPEISPHSRPDRIVSSDGASSGHVTGRPIGDQGHALRRRLTWGRGRSHPSMC